MHDLQSKPFFARSGASLAVNLLVACLLAVIAMLDVIIYPIADWQPDQVAPISQRAPMASRSAVDELLSILDKEAQPDARFLIRRGEVVNRTDLELMERLIPERMKLDPIQFLGIWAFYFLSLSFFIIVLRRSGQHLFVRFRAMGTIILLLLLTILATRILYNNTSMSAYVAPLAFSAFVLAPLLGQTMAFALHLLAVSMVGPILGFTPGMILIPLSAGWLGLLLLKPGRGPFFKLLAGLVSTACGLIVMTWMSLFATAGFDFELSLTSDLVGLGLGLGGAGLAAALLHYPITLMFGGVPKSKLIGLGDLEHPVLRDLAEKAPGTFQHTQAVANLAEKVAYDIGADAPLVRIGAYYHDIGKMRGPEYFVENQQGDNPHDQLKPEASVEKLRGHVESGVTIAKGADLPERIIDFLIEHHGSSTMEFFMTKAQKLTGQQPDPKRFRYRGRNPTSRETAVLMIADSVEAASRTLKEPSHEKIEQLVRTIMFEKLLRGYLDDSGLSSKDLKAMGRSLIRSMEAQFHVRIEYPWQQADREAPALQASEQPPSPPPPQALIAPVTPEPQTPAGEEGKDH